MRTLAFWAAGIFALAGCANPTLTVKQGYNFSRVRSVALLGFKDAPNEPGSGAAVASIFQKYLLRMDYQVIEREQVEKVLEEQALSVKGVLDPKVAKELGRVLGVDALILGQVTEYSREEERLSYVGTKEVTHEPIIERRTVRVKKGDEWVTEEKDVVTGTRTHRRDTRIPQTQLTEARVGLAARMVDVQTGEVLWIASTSRQGYSLGEATEDLSRHIFAALKKTLSRPAP